MPAIQDANEQNDRAHDFIAAGIDGGLTSAQDADTHYRRGEWAVGDAAHAKALESCMEAERRLEEAAPDGPHVQALRARLGALRSALARLDQGERDVA